METTKKTITLNQIISENMYHPKSPVAIFGRLHLYQQNNWHRAELETSEELQNILNQIISAYDIETMPELLEHIVPEELNKQDKKYFARYLEIEYLEVFSYKLQPKTN